MTASVVVTGRLEMTLVIEADGRPRSFAMAATLATICGLGATLLVVVVVAYFLVPNNSSFTPNLVLALLPTTLLSAVARAWQSWAAAEGLYRELSWMRVAQALGITGIQVIIGLVLPTALGLAVGYILGVLLSVLASAYMMPLSMSLFLPVNRFIKDLSAFWAVHKKFPMYALPADFINTGAGQLPLFFIVSQFGAEASGIYALTIRILGGPISLLGTAVLDVFKRNAAISYRDQRHCRDDFLRTFWLLASLGVILAIGIILVAEPAFAWAFGDTWRRAGVMAVWLMPMFALRFVASPLSYVFYIVGAQKVDLIWQCGLMGMTLFVFMIGLDFEASIKSYATGYAGMYVIYLILSYRFSKGDAV